MAVNHTVSADTNLADLNTIISRQEKIGFQLSNVQAKTDSGTNFTQLTFEDKLPNNGPYSTALQTPPDPPLNGKILIFKGSAYIGSNSVSITVLR
jgi:hypothetical protein